MSKKKSEYDGMAIKYGKEPTVWIVQDGKRIAALSHGDYVGFPFYHVTLDELDAIPIAEPTAPKEAAPKEEGDEDE